MRVDRVEALVIGGGVTGTGIARDLAMRGFDTMLVEAGDFSAGATGANHGMLHSGARYAVNDPICRECAGGARYSGESHVTALRILAVFYRDPPG